MPRQKKPRGRPPQKRLAPRINASAEDIAGSVLRAGKPGPFTALTYTCRQCTREVAFPDILHDDGMCSECHESS